MKIAVIKLLFNLLIFSLLSCNHTQKNILKNIPEVDYDRDSIYYRIDIKNDDENSKELILLTKEYIVEDSVFGGIKNPKNWDRAWEYCKLVNQKKGLNKTPKHFNTIFIYENGKFQKVMNFKSIPDDIIVLRQGNYSDFLNNKPPNCFCENPEYLKVLQMDALDMSYQSFNICYGSGEWAIFSIEYMEFYDEYKKIRYCIDSTTNFRGYSKDEYEIFDFNSKDTCIDCEE